MSPINIFISSGAFKASIIGLAYAMLAIMAGLWILFRKPWVRLTTQIFESLNDYAQNITFGEKAIEAIYKDLNIIGYQLEETKMKLVAIEARANVLKQQKDDKDEALRRKIETFSAW